MPADPIPASGPAGATGRILAAFGGPDRLAEALGEDAAVTRAWAAAGAIPVSRHGAIRASAEQRGLDLDPAVIAASDSGLSEAVLGEHPADPADGPEPSSGDGTEAEPEPPPADPARLRAEMDRLVAAEPAPGPAPEARRPPASAAPQRRGGGVLAGLALVVALLALVAAGAALTLPLWAPGRLPQDLTWEGRIATLRGELYAEAAKAVDPARIDQLGARVDQLSQQLAEQPQPVDLGPVGQRIDALEQRLAALDPQALQQRLQALEARPAGGADPQVAQRLDRLEQRLATLASGPATPGQTFADPGAAAPEGGAAIPPGGSGAGAASAAVVAQQIEGLETRLEALRAAVAELRLLADQMARLEDVVAENAGARESLAETVRTKLAELVAMEQQLAEMRQQVGRLDERVTRAVGRDVANEAVVLAIGQLHAALVSNRPYGQALKSLAALAEGDPDLQALIAPLNVEPYMSRGTPVVETLRVRLNALSYDLINVELLPEDEQEDWFNTALWQLTRLGSYKYTPHSVEDDPSRQKPADIRTAVAVAEAALAPAQRPRTSDAPVDTAAPPDLERAVWALDGFANLFDKANSSWLADAQHRLLVNRITEQLDAVAIQRLNRGG